MSDYTAEDMVEDSKNAKSGEEHFIIGLKGAKSALTEKGWDALMNELSEFLSEYMIQLLTDAIKEHKVKEEGQKDAPLDEKGGNG